MIMTKQELLKVLEKLPDNTEIVVCDGIDNYEIFYTELYPEIADFPAVLSLSMNDRCALQFNLDEREASKNF